MATTINLCTSVLPAFSFDDVVDIARTSGYQGIELRVDDHYHKGLAEIERDGKHIKRVLDEAGLQVPVLSSYIPLLDLPSITRLLECCRIMGASKARVVMPRSAQAAVVRQARVQTIVPSYDAQGEPRAVLAGVQALLKRLERHAAEAGVQLLLELHWGTVMSSFSSAYYLLRDLSPECIALTFDPANMLVEGKEDWEFGIKLIRPYLANVHVKNVRWYATHADWEWAWAPLTQGMTDWPGLLTLLKQTHFTGDYAAEDFLTPTSGRSAAIAHLTEFRAKFYQLHEQVSADDASALHDALSPLPA